MKHIPLLRALLVLSCLPIAAARAAEEGDEAPSGLVRLPAFEAKSVRPWLYSSVPGYEVLSLETERSTRRIVEELQRAGRFLPLFFPGEVVPSPTMPDILLLDRYAQGSNLAEAGKKVGNVGRLSTFTLGSPGGTIQFSSSDTVAKWASGTLSVAGLEFYGRVGQSLPRLPSWYAHTLSRLFGDARISDTRVVFKAHRWLVPELMPLEQVVGFKTQAQLRDLRATSPSANNALVETGMLFVRWSLLNEGGKHWAGFLDFLASGAPADDASLQRHFGLDAAGVRLSMLSYATREANRSATLALPARLAKVPLRPVEVRPADPADVARLVGHSYLALSSMATTPPAKQAYLGMARDVLTEPAALGRGDPRIEALTGRLASLELRPEAARTHVEAAVAAGVSSPDTLLLQASLRLEKAGIRLGDGKAITPELRDQVVPPVLAALQLRPHGLNAYNLLADLRLRFRDPVAAEELALLETGTREYPEAVGLIARVARLQSRNGRTEVARAMIAHGLALPPTEQMAAPRAALVRLQEELDAAAAASGGPKL